MRRLFPIYAFAMVILTLFAAPGDVYAQFTSDNGLFEVDQIRGCPGLTINITNNNPTCDCLSGCSCDFDYNGDGNYEVIPNPYQYTFDAAGTYRLEILFDNVSDFITITVEDKPAPEFEIYSCSGNGVAVNVTDTNYQSYIIDFGDGSSPITIAQGAPVQTYTYANATPRTITVQGADTGWANNCAPSSQLFTPVAALPSSEISGLTVTGPEEITLDLNTSADVLYRLFISTNGGSYNSLLTFSDARTSHIVNLPFLANNYYCFRLDALDPCGGAPVASSQVCSIRLTGVNQNSTNQLNWRTSDPDTDFTVFRDGQPLGSAANSERTYDDTPVACGTTYCYVLEARFGAAISRSNEFCITADNTLPPPPVEELATIPDGSTVELNWVYDDPSGTTVFDIYRREQDRAAIQIGSTDQQTFTDASAINPGFVTYCYEVVPRDACDNINFSNVEACVIRADGVISLRDEVQLTWPEYTGYTSGVPYYFVQRSLDGTNFANHAQVADTVFTETITNDSQVVYYRIRAVSNNGSAADSFSYVIRLIRSNQLFYPEAFTPDGDGLNDTFEVNARYVTSFSMDIFNRWGELIFHTDDIESSWDGTYRNERVPQGTYVF